MPRGSVQRVQSRELRLVRLESGRIKFPAAPAEHLAQLCGAYGAARAALGKAKLEEIKSKKTAREALAAVHGFKKAAGLPSDASALDKVTAGITGYVEKKKQQKKKMDNRKISETQLLGRPMA